MSEWNEILTTNISQITDLAVSKGLEAARTSFEAFKTEIETRINEQLEVRPVMHIKLNDFDAAKISTRLSPMLPRLVANAKLGLYSMLVGPAGCGKTTMAHQLAEALELNFGSVCLTAGASETWLFGRQTPTGFIEGPFSKIYREGGVFLADEMDAADANLLLSINTALSHNEIVNPMSGKVLKKHKDFVFIGAANTNGKGATHLYTGRSRLDAATLDRMILLIVDYDSGLEKALCPNEKIYQLLNNLRGRLKSRELDEFVSTRAYSASYKQSMAGVPLTEIIGSISANWSDDAKSEAQSALLAIPSREREGKEKFYAAYVAGEKVEKHWRPIKWQA